MADREWTMGWTDRECTWGGQIENGPWGGQIDSGPWGGQIESGPWGGQIESGPWGGQPIVSPTIHRMKITGPDVVGFGEDQSWCGRGSEGPGLDGGERGPIVWLGMEDLVLPW